MRREKCARVKNCCHSGGQRFFSICTTSESMAPGDGIGQDKDEDDPRCDFCGTCKLPMAEANRLSPFQNQRCYQRLILGHRRRTEEPVYRDLPAGNLDRIRMGIRTDPLQQGFDGDGETRFPVRAHDEAAFFAPEQSVVLASVSVLRDSTAARAPLGRMVGINSAQRNIVVETSGFKNSSENIQRNRQDFLVELSSFRLKSAQLLNGNIGIELYRKANYFSYHLPNVGIDKVSLSVPHFLEFLQGSERLEHGASLCKVNLGWPDMLAKITLFHYLSFRSENRVREILVVDVYPNHVAPSQRLFLFREICTDFEGWRQTKSLASPSLLDQGFESDKIQILLDRNRESVSWIHSQLDEEKLSGLERLAVSWLVELYSCSIDIVASFLLPPDGASNVANYLAVEAASLLALFSNSFPEIIEAAIFRSLTDEKISLLGGLPFKFVEAFLFMLSCLYLEKHSPFHPNARTRNALHGLFVNSSLLPAPKGTGFPLGDVTMKERER